MNPAPRISRGGVSPAPQVWYYVYLLRSIRSGKIYIGCTSNLQKRLELHKEGKNYSTKKMLPIELIYFEAYRSRKDAFQREKKLKHYGSGLRNLRLRIKDSLYRGGAG